MNTQPKGSSSHSFVGRLVLVAAFAGIAAALSGCCYGWAGCYGGGGGGGWHGGGHGGGHCH